MRGEQPQRVDRAVDPEIVGIDDEEGVGVDQRQRLDHAAAGFEQLLALVRDHDLNAFGAILQMRFQRGGEIMDVDHRLLDARRLQPVEAMIDQGLAGHV